VHPADDGLINQTWFINKPPAFVLQWVNPIFSPLVNEDIAAVTAHLSQKGLTTPRLIRSAAGNLSEIDPERGHWRMMTFIEGRTLHRAPTDAISAAAGHTLGRFHTALLDCEHTFLAPSRDIHNTAARMAELEDSMRANPQHPLFPEASALGEALLKRWARWKRDWGNPQQLPQRICHGDPKLSNIRFDATRDKGVCLIDLDTVGAGTLSAELGDAWRSWCNSAGEDDPLNSKINLKAFEYSTRGYLSEAPPMSAEEQESLLGGFERICMELSSRFCADALNNTYFRENREQWPEAGRHNLIRAQGQRNLAQSVYEAQAQCAAILKDATRTSAT